MRAPSQRGALGVLFAVLAVLFVVIAAASAEAARDRATLWVVAGSAAALALWLVSSAIRSFRAR